MEKYISALENLTSDPVSFTLSENELNDLIDFMIENIGNPNPYIRDSLIYNGFCELIINEKITLDQIISILSICIDDAHLYLNIHTDQQNDNVLVRSFSALVIDQILNKDTENRRLPEDLVRDTLEKASNYLLYETDYRGYVCDKGWAHSVAHGSDLLTRVILHPLLEGFATIEHYLSVIEKCLNTDYAYIDNEDERMMPVIDALINIGLTDNELKDWLIDLYDVREEDPMKKYRIEWNIKKFSMTLYSYLVGREDRTETLEWIVYGN